MRAQNEPPETVVRRRPRRGRRRAGPDDPGRAACRARRRAGARRRPDLAAEPRLAARRPRGRLAGGRARARPLRGAGRQGDAARGRGRRGRAAPGRARELEENVRAARRDERAVVEADGRDLPPELTGFDRALVDAPCSGLGVLAARPDLRWRAEPLPELQLELCVRPPSAWARRHGRLRGLHGQRRRERGRGRRVRSRGRAARRAWPRFATRAGRSSC